MFPLALTVRAVSLGLFMAAMKTLAAGQTALPPRPAVAEADALVRIARQIELMAGRWDRWQGRVVGVWGGARDRPPRGHALDLPDRCAPR